MTVTAIGKAVKNAFNQCFRKSAGKPIFTSVITKVIRNTMIAPISIEKTRWNLFLGNFCILFSHFFIIGQLGQQYIHLRLIAFHNRVSKYVQRLGIPCRILPQYIDFSHSALTNNQM
jgi:hypothetical protein